MLPYSEVLSAIASFTICVSAADFLTGRYPVLTEVYVLFGGRTLDGAVSTVVRYIIDRFYGDQDFPLAFAASVVLLIVIITVTFVQKVLTRNKIHY